MLKPCDSEVPYSSPPPAAPGASVASSVKRRDGGGRVELDDECLMCTIHVLCSEPLDVGAGAPRGEVWRDRTEAETRPSVLGLGDKIGGGKQARNEDTGCARPPCRLSGPASSTWPMCQRLERMGS